MDRIILFPEQASEMAPQVDAVYLALVGASTLVTLGILVVLVYFSFKYHRGNAVDRHIDGVPRRAIEYTWIVIPFFIFMGLFVWAGSVYFRLYAPPSDATEVQVLAKRWMWKLRHPGGQGEINTLHVPVGQPIKLLMTSEDVIHDFFVPAFRIKQDVLPGRYTSLWFNATKPGEYRLFCAEYCGDHHSRMIGTVVALPPAQFADWLASQPQPESLAAQGARYFRSFGCSGCHGGGGTVRAPDLMGLYGRPVPLDGGGTVIADETYIRDSILFPNRQVVASYKPVMPSFRGQISEEEILAIIAFIKANAQERKTP